MIFMEKLQSDCYTVPELPRPGIPYITVSFSYNKCFFSTNFILGYSGGDFARYIDSRFKAFLANCPRGRCSERNHPWVSEDAQTLT